MNKTALLFFLVTIGSVAAPSKTRVLTAEEVAKVKAAGADRVVPEQSFATTLRPQGDVWFVAESLLTPESFRYRVWKNGSELAQFAPNKDISSWSGWELTAVTFADFDRDGDDDIGVIAEYMTGIGPDGAKPFAVAEVYRNDGGAQFVHDPEIAKKLEAGKVTTMKKLLQFARAKR